jgi:hypothetical protein
VLKNVQVVAQLHRQHLVTHLIGKDRRTIFTAGEVSISQNRGCPRNRVIRLPRLWAEPRHPMGHARSILCDYALWSYTAFRSFTLIPDLSAKRLHPGRKMANSGAHKEVTTRFIAGHTRNQISYFGADGLLRHEYTVDVLGNARDSTTPPTIESQTDLWCHNASICYDSETGNGASARRDRYP